MGTYNVALRPGNGSPDITCSTVIIVMLAPMPRPMANTINPVMTGLRFKLRHAKSR